MIILDSQPDLAGLYLFSLIVAASDEEAIEKKPDRAGWVIKSPILSNCYYFIEKIK